MFTTVGKRIAAQLPHHWQQGLKRRHFRHQITSNTFRTNEPEWELSSRWLRPGDWAIDVGANIGHYTKRFSDLVGEKGRVIAFEPVPATFELLTANTARFTQPNVTLLNVAASDSTQLLGMSIPDFSTGLKNYYGASITADPARLRVMTCAIDSLHLAGPVRLLKVDAEGHDAIAILGAKNLIAANLPTIVIESGADVVGAMLEALGYRIESIPGSSNMIFRHPTRPSS
jgi:FkbM family methyltransferase